MAEHDPERPGRKPNFPPPPETRDDAPNSVNVPQMEPPPSSLQAMVAPGRRAASGRNDTWTVIALVLVVLAFMAYMLRRGMA
ncbi:MAG TPA: hypothetical protein VGM29_13460 [Polyangiaceae bacterium]